MVALAERAFTEQSDDCLKAGLPPVLYSTYSNHIGEYLSRYVFGILDLSEAGADLTSLLQQERHIKSRGRLGEELSKESKRSVDA
jgi:hypothetical protein